MKELQKGNKVPYHGYLLNISEYEQYAQFKLFIEKYKGVLKSDILE